MRLHEFKVDERQKAREMYPHLTEEQLDEILTSIKAQEIAQDLKNKKSSEESNASEEQPKATKSAKTTKK